MTTMSVDSTTLERHLKKTTIVSNLISLIIALATTLAVIYGFYYNTMDTLNSHTEAIKEIKTEVKDLNASANQYAVTESASKEQIKALQEQIKDVKRSQERVEEKIDKLILMKKAE